MLAISSENFKGITKLKTKYKKVFEYPTRVYVSPTIKKNASLVTLETLDQPYLLSKIANIFLDHEISIDSARITTLGEKVEDNFTVIDEKTKSCISQNKTNQLQKKLKSL
jgi:[protein-PII] uridylyltransferase